jgi:hypothetical protein
VNRTRDTGLVTSRRFCENTLDLMFLKNGAPAHSSENSRMALIRFSTVLGQRHMAFLFFWPLTNRKYLGHHQRQGELSIPQPKDFQELLYTVET